MFLVYVNTIDLSDWTRMKQILQDMSHGSTYIAEAPAPSSRKGSLLIASIYLWAMHRRMLKGND